MICILLLRWQLASFLPPPEAAELGYANRMRLTLGAFCGSFGGGFQRTQDRVVSPSLVHSLEGSAWRPLMYPFFFFFCRRKYLCRCAWAVGSPDGRARKVLLDRVEGRGSGLKLPLLSLQSFFFSRPSTRGSNA